MELLLGKIKSINFGHYGYQEQMLAVEIHLTGNGWGTVYEKVGWWKQSISVSNNTKWAEAERSNKYSELCFYISFLLEEANVRNINQLVDIPIEAEFDQGKLVSFRILKEVL